MVLMLWPAIQAFPFEGGNIPVIMEIRVVFPAPLGPSKPKISPFLTCKQKEFTATWDSLPPDFLYYFLIFFMTNGYLWKFSVMFITVLLSSLLSSSSCSYSIPKSLRSSYSSYSYWWPFLLFYPDFLNTLKKNRGCYLTPYSYGHTSCK